MAFAVGDWVINNYDLRLGIIQEIEGNTMNIYVEYPKGNGKSSFAWEKRYRLSQAPAEWEENEVLRLLLDLALLAGNVEQAKEFYTDLSQLSTGGRKDGHS